MLLKNLRPADDYDRFATETLAPWDTLFIARIRALAEDLPAGTLADIGTATAVVPVQLASDPQMDGWHFVGVDLDPEMLEEGVPRLERLGLADRIDLKVGDALALPFEDGTLSMVVSRATLHHLPDKALSLTEMFRVLQPGGIGIVHDMRRDAPQQLLERFTQMRAAANYPPTHLEEKVTLAEARELVEAAGVAEYAQVTSPSTGLGALGFEILLKKPGGQS
jgi:ubiquinone/menaquinone biosynthesis C-methylase UbiE